MQAEERGPRNATRIPFGSHRQKLAAPPRPGFVRRWFNDEPGRIAQARDAGYSHVNDPVTNQPMTHTVGVAKQGGGLTAYLMEIPAEFYEEDTRAKDDPLRRFDDQLKRGAAHGMPGQDGRYVPTNPDGSSRIKIDERSR